MRISRLWTIGFLLLVAGGAAHAQVELVYKLDGKEHVISGTEADRPVYSENDKRVPAAGGGEWVIRPTDAFAAPLGAVDISYSFQPFYRLTEEQKAGMMQLNYTLSFHSEEPTQDLYCVAAWEVDGRVVQTAVRKLGDTDAGHPTASVYGQMPIKAVERRGYLRAYLLQGGKSLRGISKRELEFAPLRASLDAGDYAAVTAWLQGPGRERALPQSFFPQLARSGNAELLELALSGPGAKHAKRDDGRTNLLAAAETGREGCVAVLLKHGADVNASDLLFGSALSHAIRAESVPVVQALFAAGVDPEHFAWNDYKEPLRMAFEGGNATLIRLLLDHGLKMPVPINTAGYFRRAVERGQIDAVQLILQRVKDPGFLRHEPVLLAAAENEDHPMLNLLLAAGFSPTVPGPKGETAIMGAAAAGDPAGIKILQKGGANLTEHDQANRTAAAWALQAGRGELAASLLKESPLSGAPASRLLHDAVLQGNGELTSALLAQDVMLDLGASDADDVLTELVRSGNLPVLTRALAHGLDVNRNFYNDWNLVGMAQRFHQAEVVALLEKQAGHALEGRKPAVTKLPVEVFKRGSWIASGFGQDFRGGEAQVDVYVDADGMPRVPLLRSASDEKIGRAALANILSWRFNRLTGGANGWRRVVIPFYYSPADLAGARVYQEWEVQEYPIYKPKALPDDQAEVADIRDAAWVRFTISASGAVISPRVLSVTVPSSEETALKKVSNWEFYPAKINQMEVTCQEEGVVLLPSGHLLGTNCWAYFGKAKITPELITGHQYLKPQKSLDAEQRRAMVVATFVVDRRGFTKKITVLGSPDPHCAKLAVEVCRSLQYKPVVIDGVETEYSLVLALVFGNPNDQ